MAVDVGYLDIGPGGLGGAVVDGRSLFEVLDEERMPCAKETHTEYLLRPVPGEHAESAAVRSAGGETLLRAAIRLMGELSAASKRLELESLAECTEFLERLGDLQRSLDGARYAAVSTVARMQKQALAQPSGQAAKEIKKELGESRTIWDVVEKTGKQSREKSRHDVRRAEAATELYPRFGAALRAGDISVDYLDVLRSVITSPDLKERARADEVALLASALAESPDRFRMTVKAWKFRVAPRAAEQQVKREAKEEKVNFFRADEGFRVSGWLSALNGTIVDEALRNIIGVPSKEDRRSGAQRNAEALVGMARAIVESGSGEGDRVGGAAGAGHVGKSLGAGHVGKSAGTGVVWANPEFDDESAGGTLGQGIAGPKSGTRRSPRFQTLVHVPLSTLVHTTKAIEKGCEHVHHLERAMSSESTAGPEELARSGRGVGSAQPVGSENESEHGAAATRGNVAATNADAPTIANAPRCPVTGSGLGGRGRCLDGREEITGELHEVLGEIRTRIKAGVCPDLMEGLPPATLSDGTVLAPSQFARILCDSGISRVVLSAHGEPLDASRAQRRFSVTQEKAILARDRTCRYPGCARGVEYAEIHHAQEWEHSGPTIVDNAVLLCFHHHQHIHSEHIIITHHAGGFVFTKPGGRIVGIRRHEGGL